MAKIEREFKGNFDEFIHYLDKEWTSLGVTSTMENFSNHKVGDVKVAVRVIERFGMLGSNRVSLNITIVGNNNDIYLSAITSGGSQAMFFKLNTISEHNFVKRFESQLNYYIENYT